MITERGNGCSCGFLCRYILSISAVWVLSLYVPDACPLHPLMLIRACSASMSACVTFSSSCPSAPVSARILNITA